MSDLPRYGLETLSYEAFRIALIHNLPRLYKDGVALAEREEPQRLKLAPVPSLHEACGVNLMSCGPEPGLNWRDTAPLQALSRRLNR
jgi:hypothetical protein